MEKSKDETRKRSIDAVAHFVALMHAHERGELAKATLEQAALENLGVRVRITGAKGVHYE